MEGPHDASVDQRRDYLYMCWHVGVREAGGAAGGGRGRARWLRRRARRGAGQGRLATQIEHARQDARRGPNAKAALERLGYLHVSQARVTSDAGHYKLAEAVAECLQASYPGDAAALLLRGHVLHQLHRFKEAEQVARELVARRTVVLDYGLLGDALMGRDGSPRPSPPISG